MNHIYRSIWNNKTGTFTAVSENTKTGGKQACAGTSVVTRAGFALKALATSLLLAFGSTSYAMPVGGVVAAGSASVTSGNGSMTVNQSSQNVVLNWQSFNIGATEAVRFVQPNSTSVALNRVIGADPSSILGSLSANGKVFLVNPNGILFGKGASVNVGGLVASTLNISDSDFMAGNYKFAGAGSGSVINEGSINADGGYVALLGANISNDGIINARLGSVALAAGDAITLDVVGDGLLSVAINEGAVHALVNNGGMIQADGGQVLMTAQAAGNLLQTAVNNTGVIQAQTIENNNGVIKLLGDMQSGTVNVGGKLDASAPNGGNGGFIETSAAHVKVSDGARITTAAAQGLTGSWLIDPSDYTIAATGGDITGVQLSTNLGSTDVIIQSISGGSGTNGDVNVNDTVTWSANKLTLNAQNNININTAMNASGTASLALEYGQAAVAAGNTSTVNVNAPINLPAGNNFSTKLGSDGGTVDYMVITDLGTAGDAGATSLQGVNGNLAGNYVLGANINASATSDWNGGAGFDPIGISYSTYYTGIFDGLGHTISDLTINRPDTSNVGLFSYTGNGSVIRNLGLLDGSVNGSGNVGGLVGYNNDGTISQAYVTGMVSGNISVGGLVGYNIYGTISRSYSTGAVGNADCIHCGGLVGQHAALGMISQSYATGAVSGNVNIGGLVGAMSSSTISQSYATGAVTGNSAVGGLAGYSDTGTIIQSYATGAVTGNSAVGGLLGYMYPTTITQAYATGAVSGVSGVGGLVGSGYGGTISNSYWDSYSTGQVVSVGSSSTVTSDPAQSGATNYAFKQSAYAGFDFTVGTGDWFMIDGSTRPFLQSEYSTIITNTHQLQLMAMDLAASYNLARNIDASATAGAVNSAAPADASGMWSNAGFAPIGSDSTRFTGVFDGLGHTISGLTINRPDTQYVGLFGHTGTDNSGDPTGTSVENGGNTTKVQSAIANASSINFANSNGNNIASSLMSFGLGVPNVSTTAAGTSVDSMLAGLNITIDEQGVNLPFGEQAKDKKDIAK